MLPTCQMNETKLEINENYEDAELSDVDDDLFVRGGKNGFRIEFDTAKKPLMTPRKRPYAFEKFKNSGLHTQVRSRSTLTSLRLICVPLCYVLIIMFAILGVMAAIAFIFTYVTSSFTFLNLWKVSGPRGNDLIVPCDQIENSEVWVKEYPKYLTNSAFRLLNINKDSFQDIVFGFGTGVDGLNVPQWVCDIYFPGQTSCFGGVIAINGKDGSELWKHWVAHEVFSINCNEDINTDGINDCLIGGRGGVFSALSGSNGNLIWSFVSGAGQKNMEMNIYTPQFIRDVNDDGVVDIVTIAGFDSPSDSRIKETVGGRIVLVSGKDGQVLQSVETLDHRESNYSPQIMTRGDGTDSILFGTGGENTGGSLFLLTIGDLYHGKVGEAREVYKDNDRGMLIPPVITDITGDGYEDIIMATFNSTVIAFNGDSLQQIWNFSFPGSVTYIAPTPGDFNGDDVPDFLIKYEGGPDSPVYYHAQITVLDGVTGKPLLENPIITSIGAQASPPLIQTAARGNDFFLYWTSKCKGIGLNSTKISKIKGKSEGKTPSDFCKARFDSKLINQLRVFSRLHGLPGSLLYDSESRMGIEYRSSLNTSLEGQNYLQMHPEMWQYFDQQQSELIPPFNVNSKPTTFDNRDTLPALPGIISSPLLPSDVRSYPGGFGDESGSAFREYSSQLERPEDVKYPYYHDVRNHGKVPGIPSADDNIHLIRRQHAGGNEESADPQIWQNYYAQLPGLNQFEKSSRPVNSRPYGYVPQEPSNAQRWRSNGKERRSRRSITPGEVEGIHRVVSSGTLAPPLNGSEGIDYIFATYWVYPEKGQVVPPRDQNCFQDKMSRESQRFDEKNKYFGMDHEEFEEAVTAECLQETDRQAPDNPDEQPNPFDIRMGQMTLYRIHLSCTCSKPFGDGQKCGSFLPYNHQAWAAYMGSSTDSIFPQKRPSFNSKS